MDKLIVYVLKTFMAYNRRSRAPFYMHQTASSCIGLFGVHTVPCAIMGGAETVLPVYCIFLALVAVPCKIIVHKLADSLCCDTGGLLLRNSKKSSHA